VTLSCDKRVRDIYDMQSACPGGDIGILSHDHDILSDLRQDTCLPHENGIDWPGNIQDEATLMP
jgi:hypothetical protein